MVIVQIIIIIIIITFTLNNKNYYINDKKKSEFQQQIIKTNLFFFWWHNTASQVSLTPSGQVAVRLSSSRCQILSPADRSVSGLNEFPFLFITCWCPAAPVNTFLQQAIHRYTLAAETPVMNFNLLSAEGAAPRVGLIKGNTPSRGRGRGHTDRLSPSYPRNYPLIAPVPQAGAYECGEHLPDTPCHCCAPVPSHPLGLRHEFMCFKQL